MPANRFGSDRGNPDISDQRVLGESYSLGGGVEFETPADHRGKGPRNWRRTDERIHEEVCEALSAHPMLDATDIEVRVDNADVILSGSVTDRWSKWEAEDVALKISGVSDVVNELFVRGT